MRSERSAGDHLRRRLRQASSTISGTKIEEKTSPTQESYENNGFQRKRMTANHIGFMISPHIDKSRSSGNVSVMVGKQLLLMCVIPTTGNESVS
jgi:hypothetical protein